MSKKDFRVLSNVTCTEPGCSTKVKQNVLDRKPDADKCFKHWPFARRNRGKSKATNDNLSTTDLNNKGVQSGSFKTSCSK